MLDDLFLIINIVLLASQYLSEGASFVAVSDDNNNIYMFIGCNILYYKIISIENTR